MSSAPALSLSGLAGEAFSYGYAVHGDIGLEPRTFEDHLCLVMGKHLGSDAAPSAQLSLFRTLHTADLYLAVGCAQPSEQAWRRFVITYEEYINEVARFVSPTRDWARELATDILGDLFMPDRSGHIRIGSFDGQQSLATWLRVIINRRAINQALLKWNSFEHLDPLKDIVDQASISRIEVALRRREYESTLNNCFRLASESLTRHERLLLLLRYEEELRVFEVARVLAIHPSGVTRQLQHIQVKLQKKMLSILAVKYHLGPEAIKECLLDLLENPAHSLLEFLKQSYTEDGNDVRTPISNHG